MELHQADHYFLDTPRRDSRTTSTSTKYYRISSPVNSDTIRGFSNGAKISGAFPIDIVASTSHNDLCADSSGASVCSGVSHPPVALSAPFPRSATPPPLGWGVAVSSRPPPGGIIEGIP